MEALFSNGGLSLNPYWQKFNNYLKDSLVEDYCTDYDAVGEYFVNV